MRMHVVVCIDHKRARISHLQTEGTAMWTVAAPLATTHHKHANGPEGQRQHPNDAKQFFHEVARALDGADRALVLGHAGAKHEFLAYLHAHERDLSACVSGVATVDHPSDRQIIAYARDHFDTPPKTGELQRALD